MFIGHAIGRRHMGMATGMPTELLLARHGESKGNVIRETAEGRRADNLDLDVADSEVALTDAGESQAIALGKWLATHDRQPDLVISSPYRRALQTAELVMDAAGLGGAPRVDERIRDRELGVLDGLTSFGVRNRLPDEAARRTRLGKFYYRPPGGESWADVALRVRSFMTDLGTDESRVLIVTHDATIMNFRYVLQRLSVPQLLDIAAATSVLNCSLTQLIRKPAADGWQLAEFNSVDHLRSFEAPVTAHEADRDVHPP